AVTLGSVAFSSPNFTSYLASRLFGKSTDDANAFLKDLAAKGPEGVDQVKLAEILQVTGLSKEALVRLAKEPALYDVFLNMGENGSLLNQWYQRWQNAGGTGDLADFINQTDDVVVGHTKITGFGCISGVSSQTIADYLEKTIPQDVFQKQM